MSTASGLLFQVAPDGRLIAYSADKGDVLLELRTGLQNGIGPPMTFAIDGKQYIALMGGLGGRPVLGSLTPGAVTSQSKPQLLVFGLDGKAGIAPCLMTTPPPTSADPHR